MIPRTLNSFYRNYVNEFGNIKFFKIDLSGQYCIPQTVNGTVNGDYINGVIFNEFENLGTGSQGGPAYNNYTSLTTSVERDRCYELTVQAETSGTNGSVAAWIDFNGDKDFDDDGERILHITKPGPSQEVTALVKIPEDAEIGITLMRVRNSSTPDLFTGCGAVDFGETEDYTINIIETEQNHYPVPDFTVELYDDGNVDLNWSLPENPGQSLVEGYEMSDWPPLGWEVKTSLTLDGTLEDPIDDTWEQYGDDMQFVYNGAFAAISADSAPDFNWLITPPVQLYSNDDLSFMLNFSSDANGYSKFYVLVEWDGEWTTVYELTDEIVYYNNYDETVTIELLAYAGKTIRVAFVTENNESYPIAIDDVVLKGIESNDKSVDGILGYNIYRNDNLIMEISDPAVLSASDIVTETENYNYCIKVDYESDESEALCEEVFYLVPLTPPLNVRATSNNNDVTVKWIAPDGGMMRFADNFEDYVSGQQVACQNPDGWTTWSLEPCSENDPYISDETAYSGDLSVVNEGTSDLLFRNDEILTTGKYSVNFMLYIPQGYNAYFNVLQEHNLSIGSSWGFQAFFDQGGEGTIDAGGYSTAIFEFEYNDWIYVELAVDLDSDWAEYSVNDELIYAWQWGLGIGGGSNMVTLHGVDWYAWSSNAPARFFIDDFQVVQLYEDTYDLSYNVYRNDDFISNTNITEFYDDDMEAGTYTYCISAVYDEGESETDCDVVTFMTAPENFTAEIQNENYVYCEWNEIVSSNLDGYKVYRNGELVSGLITDTHWTDEILEGGTYSYYVTAVYGTEESEPSNSVTLVILLVPKNLVANANEDGDIVLTWDSLGEVLEGDFVELSQHDGNPVDGLYQYFNNGYGVVFDLSAYPGATIEMADFHHASWGLTGSWFYKFHVVDWTTATSIAEFGPFTTTGDDIWETEISLGSVEATGNLIGIFMEPMSNDPADAYPILSSDENLDGFSIRVYLNDLTQYINSNSDFLLDLWIFAPEENKLVQPNKVKVDNLDLKDSRKPYNKVKGEIIPSQKVKGTDALFGYNVYYAHESDPFEFIDIVYDTTYSHIGAGLIQGMHNYYVTAIFSEGESEPSNIATEYITEISDNKMENMRIYPNPIVDVVNINTDFDILSVKVINSKGQVIYTEEGLRSNNYQINIADQPSGIYNIRIETEDGWVNRKMIKK